MSRSRTTATINCPRELIGRVIGKNGETIRALQIYTGASIQIDQTRNPVLVGISGAPAVLTLAVSMVADIIAGNFRGFALLRQFACPAVFQHNGTALSVEQPKPIYVQGYGLIPHQDLDDADGTASAQTAYALSSANSNASSNVGLGDQFQDVPTIQGIGLCVLPSVSSAASVSTPLLDVTAGTSHHYEDLSPQGLGPMPSAGSYLMKQGARSYTTSSAASPYMLLPPRGSMDPTMVSSTMRMHHTDSVNQFYSQEDDSTPMATYLSNQLRGMHKLSSSGSYQYAPVHGMVPAAPAGLISMTYNAAPVPWYATASGVISSSAGVPTTLAPGVYKQDMQEYVMG